MASSIRTRDGNQEITLSHTMYKEAQDQGKTFEQHINSMFKVDVDAEGTPFEQLCVANGMFLRPNHQHGLRPPTVKEALDGTVQMKAAGTIVREADPASRILFPAIVIAATENKLLEDRNSYNTQFDSYASRIESIAGQKFEQVVIDYGDVEASSRWKPIAQGATPDTIAVIKASEVARKIPHYAMGMEITAEAEAITSLNLVTTALTRYSMIQNNLMVDDAISDLINGNSDLGYAALPTVTMSTFDAGATGGTITHDAWIKWLMNKYLKRTISVVMGDINSALAVERRTGKPTINTDDPNSPRIDALFRLTNPQWQNVDFFMLPDGTIPADTLVGIDPRFAFYKVVSTTVDYQAVEEFVLRRVKALRFDRGFAYFREFDEAWDVTDYS